MGYNEGIGPGSWESSEEINYFSRLLFPFFPSTKIQKIYYYSLGINVLRAEVTKKLINSAFSIAQAIRERTM